MHTGAAEITHKPVMKQEVLAFMLPVVEEGGLLIDCTCGEGGHSEALLEASPHLQVIGLDRDQDILERARQRLEPYQSRVTLVNTWFDTFLSQYSDSQVRPLGILFDFGISVYHYEASQRGFSFRRDEPLDMRLDADESLSASDIVNSYPQERLADVIYQYGEERYSRRISAAICSYRKQQTITSSRELADIIFHAVPKGYRHGRIHPATRTFQALRIEVNGELDRIERAIVRSIELLPAGGRVAAISFHSLEDRIIKQTFKRLAKGCSCPPEQPQCTCSGEPTVSILTKKPLTASREEVERNAPSRSAKLRCVQKLGAS
ncbi:MAG: 16S rRNA (cytosine(1402)-N(4))-methyltransferase RsmH [Spirochaetota bacterium]